MSATVRAVLWCSILALLGGLILGHQIGSMRPCVDMGEQLAQFKGGM